jgi:hypothetical protein
MSWWDDPEEDARELRARVARLEMANAVLARRFANGNGANVLAFSPPNGTPTQLLDVADGTPMELGSPV